MSGFSLTNVFSEFASWLFYKFAPSWIGGKDPEQAQASWDRMVKAIGFSDGPGVGNTGPITTPDGSLSRVASGDHVPRDPELAPDAQPA